MNCITIFFTEVSVGENLIGVETESYLHEKCSLSDDYCFSKEKNNLPNNFEENKTQKCLPKLSNASI